MQTFPHQETNEHANSKYCHSIPHRVLQIFYSGINLPSSGPWAPPSLPTALREALKPAAISMPPIDFLSSFLPEHSQMDFSNGLIFNKISTLKTPETNRDFL